MLKRRCVAFLARELQEYGERAGAERAAVVAETATIAPEASLENWAGGPGRIVVGQDSFIRGRLLIFGHGGQISIGRWCYVGVRSEIWSMENIRVGDRVLVAHDVNIHDGTAHSLNATERHEHFRHIARTGHPRSSQGMPGVSSAPIIIEDDVWISHGVTVLKGVHIGARRVIAAGSIVTEDVPADVMFRCERKAIMEPLPK